MKLKTSLFVIATTLLMAGCNNVSSNQVVPSVSATPTSAKSQSLNDLNKELNTTVDDGGQAELKDLQKDASGL